MLSGADHAVRTAFSRILDDGSDLRFDSGVREATTRAGLVLLQDEDLPYEPRAELVDRAYDVAELLELDRYHVETLIVASEFLVYAADEHGDHVDAAAVKAAERKAATVRVESVVDDGPYQPLSVYLVEFASADDAALVAAASDRRNWTDEIQLAVAAGPRCAVLRIDFRADDEPFEETVNGLERFRSGLLAAIT
jgi:nucleotide-binding universal stress UspA family protein